MTARTPALLMAILLLMLAMAYQARAHGDAEWIQQNPSYKRYQYPDQHCCGPEHCAVAPIGKFVEVPGGVMDTQTQRVYLKSRGTGIYLSKDDDWWWCWIFEWAGRDGGKVPTCIFKPYRGS